MRIIACALVIALAACAMLPVAGVRQSTAQASNGGTITIRMSDFVFEPEHILLKAGVPVRLRLVNESGGGHDFSAPAFFAASSLRPGPSAPSNGQMEVGSHQTVEIALVPHTRGTYPLECTHFLHSFFGMHGTIEVMP
ncbi:MAG: cupredoxin domain-containing protein [Rhodopila sp.]|nr:cupredoxin domain-containing protein [Rhodopila sp.]